MRLIDLPAGSMFTVEGWDNFAIKSEYSTNTGPCECYIYGSGEMFYGGTDTTHELDNLMVIPLKINRHYW